MPRWLEVVGRTMSEATLAQRLEASRAQGHGTMSVALVTVPVARHSKTPTLAEWHEPRSSALMMSSLASAG